MIETVNAIRHSHVPVVKPPAPRNAVVLAAGLGMRMRPITNDRPKPLVRVGGHALIDYAMQALARSGVERIVVNVHYLPDQIEDHVARFEAAEVRVSDERGRLLDSGGGVRKALDHFSENAFFVLNSDSFWVEGFRPNLDHMATQWNPDRMDVLLLVTGMSQTVGYEGMGDFDMDAEGRLARRDERKTAPFVYAGAAMMKRELFENTPDGPFSLNAIFDRALERERLFGVRLDGLWFHVGTPDSIREAEEAIARSAV